MKEYLIPESAVDRIIACVAREDNDKFDTCREVHVLWAEIGIGYTNYWAKKEGWKEGMAEGRAHRKFLSSLAAGVGLGYQSMLNRQRVGDSVIARGYLGGENEAVSYQAWVNLHANAEKGRDGLILEAVLDERLEWFHKEADEHGGQPPSVLDIQNQYKKNGEIAEWLLSWRSILRIAKKIVKMEDVPFALMEIVKFILSYVDADFSIGIPIK